MKGISLLGAAAAAAPLIASVSAVDSAATTNGPIPVGAAKAAIDAMNDRYYNATDGRWNTQGAWWLTGIALQTVIDYMLLTSSHEYLEQVQHTIELQKGPLEWWPEGGGLFRADSTDDTGWWALAMVSLFDLTGETEYLDIARLDEAYMYDYWIEERCGGGLIWDIPSLGYKSAISNEQYVKLTASLHNRIPGDDKYLKKAVQAWEWFRDSGMINGESLVNDGLAEEEGGACSNNGQTTWTYNQGVILGGLVELHRATGDDEYLEEARRIADAVLASEELSPGGILTEPCDAEEGCSGDAAAFKGIFVRSLAELDGELEEGQYGEYLVKNAGSAWRNARNDEDMYSVNWAGPFDEATVGSQASAVSLLLRYN